jgi:uncharacterized membrane protein YdjX (TVP38/TMEM64 family)
MLDRSSKAVIALAIFALLMVAAMPVSLFVAVILMLLGHVVGGLALFGGTILAASGALAIAGFSGVRHARRLISAQTGRILRLGSDDYSYLR